MIALLVALLFPVSGGAAVPQATPDVSGPPTYRNTAPGIAYVGTKLCGQCHENILRKYLNTDMGRALQARAESEFPSFSGKFEALRK